MLMSSMLVSFTKPSGCTVNGSIPEGLVSPHSTSAMTWPGGVNRAQHRIPSTNQHPISMSSKQREYQACMGGPSRAYHAAFGVAQCGVMHNSAASCTRGMVHKNVEVVVTGVRSQLERF